MIAQIRGQLLCKSPAYSVIDVRGVGYRVIVPLTTFYELPEVGQPVTLHIHTHVKQDAINLFGFYSQEERDVFQLLLAVNGIGPKLAINILSGIAAGELINAVSLGNLKRLVAIPGVGKRMAERIILELQDRVMKLVAQDAKNGFRSDSTYDDLREDALSALINLGYKPQAAKDILDKVCERYPVDLTLDTLLKQALKLLAG